MHAAGSAQLTTEVSTYVFFRGTQPTGIGAQKCRKISVGDRYLSMEPTNICGYTSMNSSINILILNDGCATISIGDNNGKEHQGIKTFGKPDQHINLLPHAPTATNAAE